MTSVSSVPISTGHEEDNTCSGTFMDPLLTAGEEGVCVSQLLTVAVAGLGFKCSLCSVSEIAMPVLSIMVSQGLFPPQIPGGWVCIWL